MKRTRIILVAAIVMLLSGTIVAGPSANDGVIPLIEMRDVPLTDAIRQVARTARLNILLDPRLSQAPYTEMKVSVRWEKVTAREALTALLDNYGLMLVESRPRLERS